MSEKIKVIKKTIGEIQYLFNPKNNDVFDLDSQEYIGVYDPKTKTIIPDEEEEEEEEEERVEIRVIKLKKDMFSNKEEWEYVKPFDFRIEVEPDDNEYAIYNSNGIIVSYSTNRDEFEDITDIGMPFKAPLQHSYEVDEVFINTLVGYNGSQTEGSSIFEFPIYWNGTIDVGDNTEKINTDVNLEEKVGDLQVQMEEDDDIDDYSNSQLASIVLRAINTEDYAQVKLIKNVVTDIENDFLKPLQKSIQKGKVSIPVKHSKKSLKNNRKKFIELFNRLKNKLDTISKKTKIRSRDLKEVKDEIPNLKYDEIRDDEFNPNSSSDLKAVESLKLKFNKLLTKYREQQETQTAISDVSAPETIVEQSVVQPVRQPLQTIPEEKELGVVAEKVAGIEKLIAIQKNIDDLEEEIKAESNEMRKKMLIRALGALIKKKMTMKSGTGISNPKLYEEAKAYADNIFKKPSAFKSGFIVKKYKELGGTYSGDKPNTTGIARWFKEEWKDIGNKEYPVFRPTLVITEKTPLTPNEIKPSNLKKQIELKQKIKGKKNLPPFEPKVGGKVVALGVQAEKIPKQDEIWKWSNPEKVAEIAKKYLGDMAVVFRSTKPKKKYMIFDPINNKWVFFGEMGYEDFTKHKDPKRRENYLTRTASMKGNWKNNRYSANNLSRNILW